MDELNAQVNYWNEHYPIGTAVKFQPVLGINEFVAGNTTSMAYILSGHTAVVHITNRAGCVGLTHCKAVEA
ncbi:MAG: hypothetical protein IPK75_20430 [Acidobacteria bacterium]|nr:hypothetical protein [Acidobacteriota bacterium]